MDAGMWRDYIGLLGRSSLPHEAEVALSDMKKRDGVNPSEGCYLRVIRAHCEQGAWSRAVEVRWEMSSQILYSHSLSFTSTNKLQSFPDHTYDTCIP